MSGPILVTGAAGFIGYHVAARLLADGRDVVGIDNFTPYYDPALKEARFARLEAMDRFSGVRLDLADAAATRELFAGHRFDRVVHLAAQPGVRYALDHPDAYTSANLVAFVNVLEGCRHGGTPHLVYASSSSVYGGNTKLPFAETDRVDQPISLYAATKRANELMAHSYAHLFGLPCTGLRFFTVYGPWGRPDMAIYAFTEAIAAGRPIHVADGGRVRRDFTYVDDVVDGILRLLDEPPASQTPPVAIYNIGGDRPADLNSVIGLIESALDRKAERIDMALPPGDVEETRAATGLLAGRIGHVPSTTIEEGIRRFVAWYRAYNNLGERP